MRKSFLIARSNIRKAKGQTVAIVVLILLAALMLNLWLMLSMDYRANFDRYHDALNAEHVTVSVDDKDGEVKEFLSQTLKDDSRVSQYGFDKCMHTVGTFPYNGGEMNYWFIILDKRSALTRSVGRVEITEEGDLNSGVYLPMLYRSDDIRVGKSIEITFGGHTEEYTVCGFFNSVMLGSHNCVITETLLTEDKYAELEAGGYVPQATLCSVRLNDLSENVNFEAEIKSEVSEKFPERNILNNCYDIVSQSRYISQGICSSVVSTMAFLVLLIALVVIASNISNYIQVNMKNLGALKAAGYTSKQLIGSLLLQFSGLTFLSAIVGAGLSYSLFPAVNTMMISQTGIPYTIRFLPLPLLFSILILVGAVALAVWLSARKINRIEPITALRSGVQTHSFRRNHLPLAKTKVPLNLALSLKMTFSGMKNNIAVCITVFVLSLVMVFSGLMTENVIADMTPFLNLIVGETADSCISIRTEIEDRFLSELNADGRVDKVYLYTSLNVSHVGGADLMATLCDDFSEVNNPDVIYKGRFPKYDNEIALGAKYAKENDFAIGDEIEITGSGKKEKYLICGFTQVSNYLGRDCLMTRQGYGKLGEIRDLSYYINLADGTDIDAFNKETAEKFAGGINATINIDTTTEGAAAVYVSLMTVIVTAILLLTVIIIAFVLYLLVRTMLNNKTRDYGIMKSLGFTTGQLILQTALTFMPAMIISTVIGLTVGSIVVNPLLNLFFSNLGILKCSFAIPVRFIVAAGAGLILFTFATACLLSLKIKKITPRALLSGE